MISRHKEEIVEPRKIGFEEVLAEEIKGGDDVGDSAEIFRTILDGKGTDAQESVVLANAGAALNILKPKNTVNECIEFARESLRSGKALDCFKKLIDMN